MKKEELIRHSKATLDASLDRLDAATVQRLRRARQQALHAPSPRRSVWWLGSLASATAAAALIWLNLTPPEAGIEAGTTSPIEETGDLAMQSDDVDIIEQLEFYHWLDQRLPPG